MSFLESLKLVNGKRVRQLSPIEAKRKKLSLRLPEQMEFCETHISRKSYAPKRLKTISNKVTSQQDIVAVAKRVKKWYWMSESVKMNIAFRYGASILIFGKAGKNAVEVANHPHVVEA